ncbi:MAG TPA: 4a-hydroxytetrahydrobiopterin dehydratase, partial [Opitutaceae bacterium]|nr:4a-hydroxytetrahydrobiopterin dehydratase [Opitutaceae bacterium]
PTALATPSVSAIFRHMATKPLSSAEIEQALAQLPGWSFQRDALERTFTLADFRAALAFMVRVGFEAEAMDHHPDWTNVYNRVAVRLNTHDAGGKVTAKDVELARRIQRLAPT